MGGNTVRQPGDNSMRDSRLAAQTAAVAVALAKLGTRPGERVLIMLPDGPGFAAAFAGTIKHGAVPLPVNPLLFAHDILAAAAASGARLLLASADQIHTLTDLGAQPPVLIDGPQGPWAAALPLCSSSTTVPRPRPAQTASDSAPTARTRVVLLPHAPTMPTDTRPHQRRTPERPPA
jgi:acyl-CoA synthetase (AMP-forming)/AMP-acid ligase II